MLHRSAQSRPSLEEYVYYASITRREERVANEESQRENETASLKSLVKRWFSKGVAERPVQHVQEANDSSQKTYTEQATEDNRIPALRQAVDESEWEHASRAARIVGWGNVAYLIVTDILGPSAAPWSFAQMGYGPGFALYTVLGALSAYSGWILWKVFIQLDSDRYPIRNYADIFLRLFGPGMKHFVNVAQAIQLVMVLGVVILINGQAISQMSYGVNGDSKGLCFIVCLLVFTLAGCLVAQIRTLQRLGWLAHFAVWLSLLTVFILMGLVSHYPPNFGAVAATFGPQWEPGPIRTFAGAPPDEFLTVVATINGLNQVMLCYGGTAFFIFFLAEMRRPLDFWKSLFVAQTFIYVVYVVFGMYIYHWHGQFTYNPAIQGISNPRWQIGLNAINLVSSLITCGLYANIGVKIAYIELFEPLLHLPPLTSPAGKVWWACLVPLYWSLGFIVGAAIPQLASISGLIAAIFSGGFTYILPALVAIVFWVRMDATLETERFEPASQVTTHEDKGLSRYYRGFMKRPMFNLFNVVYFIAGIVGCGLGCYAAIHQLSFAFRAGIATSFTCASPV
ncbi:hypothetical protein K445DRAFT_311273 [Daldinia sp. EC12]|nr:hypothetical protein K445DRAFT_311273 [Daldinia sp. EC12]